ncbi:hypothetical protein V2J09_015790 [Rumex salicifolius]
MAICKHYGYPNLFITFTCNSKWHEIVRFVEERGLRPKDRPDIICRVFKLKLHAMIKEFKAKKNIWEVIYAIEFQKCSLPHAHILLFLDQASKLPTTSDIDKVISAKIPNRAHDPALYNIVTDLMMHGPCGPSISSSCMVDGKCKKYFPKPFVKETNVDDDGYLVYRRLEKNGVHLDNRYVVPYNAELLLKYNAHINVEWCNRSASIKYLFKYINKGHDRVTVAISNSYANIQNDSDVDEIKDYYNCRYLSACEAAWRIVGFDIHYRYPSVQRLTFHLPGKQSIFFGDDDPIDDVVDNFPGEFVWLKSSNTWKIRDKGRSVERIHHASPGSGEMYYLRVLLNHIKGPTSFEELGTIEGMLYSTFKEACYALGLLDNDKEYIDGITESSFWGSAHYLRSLFVVLLTWKLLADDIIYSYQMNKLDKLSQKNGRYLSNYKTMLKVVQSLISDGVNKLIQQEVQYDRGCLADEHTKLLSRFTDEQKGVYDEIMNAILSNGGGVFFLYGYGGTRKTFIWRALSACIRSKGEIVLTVASSGNAALLIPSGRTAHSRFNIPIKITKVSTCEIGAGTDLFELICAARLIIWDEAPMMNIYCFEAVDKTLRDILCAKNPHASKHPFGGKVVVFGGDFRQILPVITKEIDKILFMPPSIPLTYENLAKF